MSDAKHTPGPWYAEIFPCVLDAIEEGSFRWCDRDHAKEVFPGAVGCVWQGSTDTASTGLPGSIEVSAENAFLIAAAPDLLAALEGVLRVADRATVEFDAARAAIAKARGES
jgi:hypothetical protein